MKLLPIMQVVSGLVTETTNRICDMSVRKEELRCQCDIQINATRCTTSLLMMVTASIGMSIMAVSAKEIFIASKKPQEAFEMKGDIAL